MRECHVQGGVLREHRVEQLSREAGCGGRLGRQGLAGTWTACFMAVVLTDATGGHFLAPELALYVRTHTSHPRDSLIPPRHLDPPVCAHKTQTLTNSHTLRHSHTLTQLSQTSHSLSFIPSPTPSHTLTHPKARTYTPSLTHPHSRTLV